MTGARATLHVRTFGLCPELKVWAADAPVPLWEALELETGKREGPPFWGHAWPGSLALARWVMDQPSLVREQPVLDFATGCGLSAIAAARAGASSVLATDIDVHAITACHENAKLNGCSIDAQQRDVIGIDEGWSVILVGDVFYEAELSARAFGWLEKLARRGATVLIGDPGRSFLPREKLRCEATYPLDVVHAWDSVSDRPPRVWRVLGS